MMMLMRMRMIHPKQKYRYLYQEKPAYLNQNIPPLIHAPYVYPIIHKDTLLHGLRIKNVRTCFTRTVSFSGLRRELLRIAPVAGASL